MACWYADTVGLQRKKKIVSLFYRLNGVQRRRLQFSKVRLTPDCQPRMCGAKNAAMTPLTGGCGNCDQQTRARPDSSGAQNAEEHGENTIDPAVTFEHDFIEQT